MVIDRNDPEPGESSGTGVSGRDSFGPEHDNCVNRYIVCLRLREFETQVRMVSTRFKSIFGYFYDPICLQK